MNDTEAKDRLIVEVVDAFTAIREQGMRGLHRIRRDVASMGHLQVLVRLQADGPQRVGALARSLGMSAASATGMLRRMAERGLVRRVRDQRDRRVVLVELAPEGKVMLEKLSRSRAGLQRSLARLDEDELTQLRNGLNALNRATRELAEEGDGADDAEEPSDRRRETSDASEAAE